MNWIGVKSRQFSVGLVLNIIIWDWTVLSSPVFRDRTKLSWLVANSVHTTNTDKTRQDSLVLSMPAVRLWNRHKTAKIDLVSSIVLQLNPNHPVQETCQPENIRLAESDITDVKCVADDNGIGETSVKDAFLHLSSQNDRWFLTKACAIWR